jgi:hypothetical protein
MRLHSQVIVSYLENGLVSLFKFEVGVMLAINKHSRCYLQLSVSQDVTRWYGIAVTNVWFCENETFILGQGNREDKRRCIR